MAKLEIPSIVVHNGSPSVPGSLAMEQAACQHHSHQKQKSDGEEVETRSCDSPTQNEGGSQDPSPNGSSQVANIGKSNSLQKGPDAGTGLKNTLVVNHNNNRSNDAEKPLRSRSRSSGKMLTRSHAMREATSPPPPPPPPPDPLVHENNISTAVSETTSVTTCSDPISTTTITTTSSSTSPTRVVTANSTPKINNNNINNNNRNSNNQSSNGNNNHLNNNLSVKPTARHKLKNQSSSQGSGENWSCLSRESSTETYTDATGVDLETFIEETINQNAKNRSLLLKFEQDFFSLARDTKLTHYRFPMMSSFHRMFVHRVAAWFGMDHNLDSSGGCVVVNRTKQTRIPDKCFSDFIREGMPFTEEPKRSILKRDSASFEDGQYKSCDEKQLSLESRRSKSFEEREEEYAKARRRIFDGGENSFRSIDSGQDGSEALGWHDAVWTSSESDPTGRLLRPHDKRSHLLKVESFEGRDTLKANSLKQAVSKSYSFGDYSGSGYTGYQNSRGLQRGDSNASSHSNSSRGLAKQDSGSSMSSRLSPSSGYKSQSQRSDATLSTTPSPTATPISSQGPLSPEPPTVIWPLSSLGNIPPGSVLINPATGQPICNADGTVYRYDPDNPLKLQAPPADSLEEINEDSKQLERVASPVLPISSERCDTSAPELKLSQSKLQKQSPQQSPAQSPTAPSPTNQAPPSTSPSVSSSALSSPTPTLPNPQQPKVQPPRPQPQRGSNSKPAGPNRPNQNTSHSRLNPNFTNQIPPLHMKQSSKPQQNNEEVTSSQVPANQSQESIKTNSEPISPPQSTEVSSSSGRSYVHATTSPMPNAQRHPPAQAGQPLVIPSQGIPLAYSTGTPQSGQPIPMVPLIGQMPSNGNVYSAGPSAVPHAYSNGTFVPGFTSVDGQTYMNNSYGMSYMGQPVSHMNGYPVGVDASTGTLIAPHGNGPCPSGPGITCCMPGFPCPYNGAAVPSSVGSHATDANELSNFMMGMNINGVDQRAGGDNSQQTQNPIQSNPQTPHGAHGAQMMAMPNLPSGGPAPVPGAHSGPTYYWGPPLSSHSQGYPQMMPMYYISPNVGSSPQNSTSTPSGSANPATSSTSNVPSSATNGNHNHSSSKHKQNHTRSNSASASSSSNGSTGNSNRHNNIESGSGSVAASYAKGAALYQPPPLNRPSIHPLASSQDIGNGYHGECVAVAGPGPQQGLPVIYTASSLHSNTIPTQAYQPALYTNANASSNMPPSGAPLTYYQSGPGTNENPGQPQQGQPLIAMNPYAPQQGYHPSASAPTPPLTPTPTVGAQNAFSVAHPYLYGSGMAGSYGMYPHPQAAAGGPGPGPGAPQGAAAASAVATSPPYNVNPPMVRSVLRTGLSMMGMQSSPPPRNHGPKSFTRNNSNPAGRKDLTVDQGAGDKGLPLRYPHAIPVPMYNLARQYVPGDVRLTSGPRLPFTLPAGYAHRPMRPMQHSFFPRPHSQPSGEALRPHKVRKPTERAWGTSTKKKRNNRTLLTETP